MPVVSAEVSSEMKNEIEGRQEGEESRSAVVRRLLESGLKRTGPARARRPVRLAGLIAGLAYLVAYVTADTTALAAIGGASIAGMLFWSVWPFANDRLPGSVNIGQ